jgi:hypothetical protein
MDWPQKVVIYDWGYSEYYDKITDKDPCIAGWAGWPCKATFTIVDKWTDSEGNIWYKLYTQQPKLQRWFELDKISKNGTVWESKSSSMFWYKELDINKAIYYRQ